MIKRILLDAGPWFAFLSQRDQHREWATAQFEQYTQFTTCEPVVTEVCHRLAYHRQSPDLALQALDEGAIVMDFSISRSLASVRSWLIKYADQGIDLADACLLAMVQDEPRCKLITTDRIFEVVRMRDRRVVPAVLPTRAG